MIIQMTKRKYDLSFSLSRLVGLQSLKHKIARKTIPTTKFGFERKIGAFIINLFLRKRKK